jgi:hypothetical protein
VSIKKADLNTQSNVFLALAHVLGNYRGDELDVDLHLTIQNLNVSIGQHDLQVCLEELVKNAYEGSVESNHRFNIRINMSGDDLLVRVENQGEVDWERLRNNLKDAHQKKWVVKNAQDEISVIPESMRQRQTLIDEFINKNNFSYASEEEVDAVNGDETRLLFMKMLSSKGRSTGNGLAMVSNLLQNVDQAVHVTSVDGYTTASFKLSVVKS